MKTTNTAKPGQVAVSIPYGLPPLVAVAEALVKEHVFTDVIELVRRLQHEAIGPSPVNGPNPTVWDRYLTHEGFLSPGNRIGLLDFDFKFEDDLKDMRMKFFVSRVVGGNGDPLVADDTEKLAQLTLGVDPKGWGQLIRYHSSGATPEWVEWVQSMSNYLMDCWKTDLAMGNLLGITNPLARESLLAQWMRTKWSAENTKKTLNDLALQAHLALIDDEDEAPEHCSSLSFKAQKVWLVTPWFANQLESQGAVAGLPMGLPIWSRDTLDALHLDEVVQRIAYEKYGQSVDAELAKSTT